MINLTNLKLFPSFQDNSVHGKGFALQDQGKIYNPPHIVINRNDTLIIRQIIRSRLFTTLYSVVIIVCLDRADYFY